MALENSLTLEVRDIMAELKLKQSELESEARKVKAELDAYFPDGLRQKAIEEIPAKMTKTLKGNKYSLTFVHGVSEIMVSKEVAKKLLSPELYEKVTRQSDSIQIKVGI